MDTKTFAIVVFVLAVVAVGVYVFKTKGRKPADPNRSDSGNDPTDPRDNPSKV